MAFWKTFVKQHDVCEILQPKNAVKVVERICFISFHTGRAYPCHLDCPTLHLIGVYVCYLVIKS